MTLNYRSLAIALITWLLVMFSYQPTSVQAGLNSQGDGTLRRLRVPILMYHYVSPLPPGADDIRIGLTVEPNVFQQHIDYLVTAGYKPISLYEIRDALLSGQPLPPNPVVLTFDDGYIDHYDYVFPVLQRHGFTATFFIITNTADHASPAYMNWSQIRTMADAGMHMEPHTKSHRDLRQRDYDFLIYEILGSQQSLDAHVENVPRMFSYPAGRYDLDTLVVLNSLSTWGAVTTQRGVYHTSTSLLEMPRLRVTGNMSVAGLAQILNDTTIR